MIQEVFNVYLNKTEMSLHIYFSLYVVKEISIYIA